MLSLIRNAAWLESVILTDRSAIRRTCDKIVPKLKVWIEDRFVKLDLPIKLVSNLFPASPGICRCHLGILVPFFTSLSTDAVKE